MKQIFQIYFTDIRQIAKNRIVSILVLGLIFLPSLYAWFNIEASWDPYGRTRWLSIAIANNDKGASLLGNHVNVGDKIISSLKNNQSLAWVFVDEKQALKGVRNGDYYAAIVIPSDFSAKIATVIEDNPQKAEIIYYVNEKINAVAPKITSRGASGIVEQVRENFVRTANGIIFKIFNELGINLESGLPTIENIRDMIFKLEEIFPEINQAVAVAIDDVNKAQEIARVVQADLPLVVQMVQNSKDLVLRLNQFLEASSTALTSIAPNIKQTLLLLQETAVALEQLTDIISDANIDPAIIASALERAGSRLQTSINVTDKLIALFDSLNNLIGGKGLQFVSDKLKQFNSKLKQMLVLVNEASSVIAKGSKPAETLVSNLNQLAKEAYALIGDILERYDSVIQPTILEGINKTKQTAATASKILTDAEKVLPDVESILNDALKGLVTGGEILAALQKRLPATEAKISQLADRIRTFEKESNLNEIINLLKNNFQKESEFFAEPAKLQENKMFPIPNYGSAMSPFFTTLALWVGPLLLVSLLTVDIHDAAVTYKSYQIYFGRYLLFLSIALLQSIVVTMGDMYILGTYVADKLWFVLFGLVLSAVFTLIIYTLVSVFGNLGKGIAVVFLVLQLTGSGGTFPVEVTPPFFQAIHPYLPFTYAISMMREAAGGIIWSVITNDLMMMGIYITITLLIGLLLKGWFNRVSAPLLKKARESKLIH